MKSYSAARPGNESWSRDQHAGADDDRIRRILTGVSCTERDLSRIKWSAQLAAHCNARLELVASTHCGLSSFYAMSTPDGLTSYHEFVSASEQAVRDTVASLPRNVSITYSLRGEPLGRCLIATARAQPFDVIVIPPRLRRRLQRALNSNAPGPQLLVREVNSDD
jgi:nucleotide-binding universal stress UspA family protein